MSLPKGFIRGGAHYLTHVGGKATISRSVIKGENRYSLWIRQVDHRGHAHFDLGGVFDSADDAASAYEYGAQPQRKKA